MEEIGKTADEYLEELLVEAEKITDRIYGLGKRPNAAQQDALRQKFNFSGYGMSYTDSHLIISGEYRGNWNYYMGFEYLDDEEVVTVGRLNIYPDTNERVAEILAILENHEPED